MEAIIQSCMPQVQILEFCPSNLPDDTMLIFGALVKGANKKYK